MTTNTETEKMFEAFRAKHNLNDIQLITLMLEIDKLIELCKCVKEDTYNTI